ncbi:MAG: 16S rRNA (guanine(527)-N(7))-methyltransferase RsmG [Bacillota bacterium]|nr:16S rRNA (guanine(527)-N(7))-methyltransferase RsmG [Bacillota bacterium]
MELLRKALEQAGTPYTAAEEKKFLRFRELVLAWNEKVNLTAIKEPEAFELRHFVDSVACCGHRPFEEAATVADLGTGAGFPGIPLAILYPEKSFLLIDSLNKRIRIVKEIAEELGLRNVRALHGRAEELGQQKEYRERFDLCVSRAVAHLTVLSEYSLPLVKTGGWFLAYKSLEIGEELAESRRALELLGGRVEMQTPAPLPELEHQLLWVRKEKPTPAKYPRKAGTPEKNPLK